MYASGGVRALVIDIFRRLVPEQSVLSALHDLANDAIVRNNHLVRPWVTSRRESHIKGHLIRSFDISGELVLHAEVLVARIVF